MRRTVPVILVLVAGCLAQGRPASEVDGGVPLDPTTVEATACTVDTAVFARFCLGCHRPGGQSPDLSFDAVPGTISAGFVVPGDPNGSPLYQKIAGSAIQGGPMPPSAALSPELVELVERWITAGASGDCEPSDSPLEPQRHHPDGWAEPSLHGTAMKLGLQSCRDCHGDDLTGRVGPSCDGCHQDEWRTTCTFCHGGAMNDTGAPPRDLNGSTDRSSLTFIAHTEHVVGARHAPYDCTTCHMKPTDVLTVGHVFDDTSGRAEVRFSEGVSAAGRYETAGRCANLYCHGNGQTPGSVVHTDGPRTCNDCHAGPNAGRSRWDTMSGAHSDHLREGVPCSDCHGATVDATNAIVTPVNHVDGNVQLSFSASTMSRTNGTCTGACHGQDHDAEIWRGD